MAFIPSLENSGLNIVIKSRQLVIDKEKAHVLSSLIWGGTGSLPLLKHTTEVRALIVDACVMDIHFPFSVYLYVRDDIKRLVSVFMKVSKRTIPGLPEKDPKL